MDIYNQIAIMYENDRADNERKTEQRKQSVYGKIPRIKEIDEELVIQSIELGKIMVGGECLTVKEEKFAEYEKHMKQLREEKEQLLIENNFSKNYLEPIFTCEICKDTGNDGLKKCACFHKRIIEKNYHNSGIETILQTENFNNFRVDYYSKKMMPNMDKSPYEVISETLADAKERIKNVKKLPCNLIFLGKTGVGKTFLCNCIAKELLDKGYTLSYYSAFKMFNDLADCHFNRIPNEKIMEIQESIYNADVLVIDDLGSEVLNSVTNAYFFDIINNRLLNNLSTIISTNCTIKDLFDKYGERVGSRFSKNYGFYPIYGNDLRML